MQKTLIVAALALAAQAASVSVISAASDDCADWVSADSTKATYTDATTAELTVGGVTYKEGWVIDILTQTTGNSGFCNHWNDVADAYVDFTITPAGASAVDTTTNDVSTYDAVSYVPTGATAAAMCPEPTTATTSATTGTYTRTATLATTSDTCGNYFTFEWDGTTDMLTVTYLSDNAVVGAVSAFAVVALASLF